MIYTISVNGNVQITSGGQARAGNVVEGANNVYDAGNRILSQNYVTVDLRNLLPDGTSPRTMAILKACSFVCQDVYEPNAKNSQVGSIRIMNVACPNQRTNDNKSGAVVAHLFAMPGHDLTETVSTTDEQGTTTQSEAARKSWLWRISNPFKVFCTQIPEQLEFQITGPSTGVGFAFTMELEVDDDEQ